LEFSFSFASWENEATMTFGKCCIGVDEVGRGPLAGPITLAVAFVPDGRFFAREKLILRDSKKLSPQKRKEWMTLLRHLRRDGKIFWATASVSAKRIDEKGIAWAAKNAASRAMHTLLIKNPSASSAQVFLDAGLSLTEEVCGLLSRAPISRVRADETIAVVALASIIAKTHRDRYMEKLGMRYPAYAFEAHKGYGTEAHYRALRRNGPTKEHRLTFLHNFATIRKNYRT
jgi:ribonuclease HII